LLKVAILLNHFLTHFPIYRSESLFGNVPVLNCIGNHEADGGGGVPADYNTSTFNFSFPSNYPFQAYASRFPVPGTYNNFGDITSSLYYSTVIGGAVKLIVMNNVRPLT